MCIDWELGRLIKLASWKSCPPELKNNSAKWKQFWILDLNIGNLYIQESRQKAVISLFFPRICLFCSETKSLNFLWAYELCTHLAGKNAKATKPFAVANWVKQFKRYVHSILKHKFYILQYHHDKCMIHLLYVF